MREASGIGETPVRITNAGASILITGRITAITDIITDGATVVTVAQPAVATPIEKIDHETERHPQQEPLPRDGRLARQQPDREADADERRDRHKRRAETARRVRSRVRRTTMAAQMTTKADNVPMLTSSATSRIGKSAATTAVSAPAISVGRCGV